MNATGLDCSQHALSAAYYADAARQRSVKIVENTPLSRDTFRLRLASPELASHILPGQFLMIRLPSHESPLLARPFALYDTWCDDSGTPLGLDIGYLVVGKATRLLKAMRTGDSVEVWGPLGNGFLPQATEHLIMVAGGIGQTPFLALGREYLGGRPYGNPGREVPPANKVTLCYGVRSKQFAAGIEDFENAGISVKISTDDGSLGHHGLVTDLLKQTLDQRLGQCRIVCCGPEPMMHAVARIAHEREVPCQVSLETPMACGIGICFSCVTKVRQLEEDPTGEVWDYKRTCVDGPVFDAAKIVF
ncbi:dihydroorotate dehydrogenase electron transfer subunit [Adhaeretor mobilis]|uniref:Dihydroorotate dehydrogenase B (NAD(+)), electron transfer subunit n=1 Tax=Adhaeretor mobilis TaxID=1930276 RepID=A0A517MZ96_9BACT|nr:dihydroorotate dehydrogenase electron transfer subunit [Adhaeretor mobilis]QDT00197.1 Dihydroorotate dehydrogenase B (NAD(+)), electron transfer subunit [Adhaeretor mobilis]